MKVRTAIALTPASASMRTRAVVWRVPVPSASSRMREYNLSKTSASFVKSPGFVCKDLSAAADAVADCAGAVAAFGCAVLVWVAGDGAVWAEGRRRQMPHPAVIAGRDDPRQRRMDLLALADNYPIVTPAAFWGRHG